MLKALRRRHGISLLIDPTDERVMRGSAMIEGVNEARIGGVQTECAKRAKIHSLIVGVRWCGMSPKYTILLAQTPNPLKGVCPGLLPGNRVA